MRGLGPLVLSAVFFVLWPVPQVRSGNIYSKTETEHFLFIYRESDRETVRELVSFCEDVYAEVTGYLGNAPPKIRCVVNGDGDSLNGMFYPFPPHIRLFPALQAEPWFGSEHGSTLRQLLTHELTHHVHLVDRHGIFGALSYVFGEAVSTAPGAFLPGWMIEGPPVLTETLFTDGGRGRNEFFEMTIRAPVLEDALFSLRQAGYQSAFPPNGRVYLAGYYLADYLREHFGDDVFIRIYRSYLSNPVAGPYRAIRRITGQDPEEIYHGMAAALRDRFERAGTAGDGTLVSPEGRGEYYPPVVTSRGLVLYRRSTDRYPAVVLLQPETGEEIIIAEAYLSDYSSIAAPADGSIVYLACLEPVSTSRGTVLSSNLFSVDTVSGEKRALTSGGGFFHPAVSSDGTRLVAVYGRGSYSSLVEIDTKTGNSRVIFSSPRATVTNPSFSPDAGTVVFSLAAEGEQIIAALPYPVTAVGMERAGSESVNAELVSAVTGPDGYGDFFPFHTGFEILYTSEYRGKPAIFSISPGSDPVLAVEDPVAAFAGRPSGGEIVYGSYSSMGYRVERKRADNVSAGSAAAPSVPLTSDAGSLPEIESERYFAAAVPVFWVPYPLYYDPVYGEPPRFAPGIMVYGSSYTLGSAWTSVVTFRTDILQPGIGFSYLADMGRGGGSYTLDQWYRDDGAGGYSQATNQRITYTYPLLSRVRFAVARGISVYAGMGNLLLLESDAPFTFMDTDAATVSYRTTALAGAGFSVTKRGGRRDFYPPLRLAASVSSAFTLPALSSMPLAASAGASAEAMFPSFIEHHVFRITANGGYSSAGEAGIPGAVPRWGYLSGSLPTDGRITVGAEYLFPIALLDRPLPLGLNVQDIAGGIHVQGVAGWDSGDLDGSFTVLPEIYLGGEVTASVGLSANIPVTFGVSVRADLSGGGNFDPLTDIRPYIGFDAGRLIGAGGDVTPRELR